MRTLEELRMEIPLWRVMSARSQYVDLAMSLKEKTETSLVLNARPDTRDTKVHFDSSCISLISMIVNHCY